MGEQKAKRNALYCDADSFHSAVILRMGFFLCLCFQAERIIPSQVANIQYQTTNNPTPRVSFTYARLGRQATGPDALGTRIFTYSANLQLDSETVVGGGLPPARTNVLTRSYDALGRSSDFTLDTDFIPSPTPTTRWVDSTPYLHPCPDSLRSGCHPGVF